MSVKQTTINTSYFGPEGVSIQVPVCFTDDLQSLNLIDLGIDTKYKGVYLFVALFTKGNEKKWFVSNARRHEDMRQAIELDIGKGYEYRFGQLHFEEESFDRGEIKFNLLMIRGDISSELENSFKDAINPEYLDSFFSIQPIWGR